MTKTAWIWLGVLLVLGLLFFLWWRHRRKVMGAPRPGIGAPLSAPAAAPAPSNLFSHLATDGAAASTIFGGISSIFSGLNTAQNEGGV